jgi:hypothetical protein
MTTTTPDAPAKQRSWLWYGLLVLTVIETLSALSEVSGIFYDFAPTTPLLILAQWLTKANLALAPLIAGAALVFAIMSRFRAAIGALAVLILVEWISDLPSFVIHGIELPGPQSGGGVGLQVLAQQFLYPVIAVVALVLAVKNTRLGLAAVLVSLPTIIKWVAVVAFGIAVMMYGF